MGLLPKFSRSHEADRVLALAFDRPPNPIVPLRFVEILPFNTFLPLLQHSRLVLYQHISLAQHFRLDLRVR